MSLESQSVVTNWNNYESCLKAISTPPQKFQTFDKITDAALATAFQVVAKIAQDPQTVSFVSSQGFTFGPMSSIYISDIHMTMQQCRELSKNIIKPLSKASLKPYCFHPHTYIDNKMYQVLAKIVPQYSYSHKQSHPLFTLNKEMWKLQQYDHGSICPCYARINNFVHSVF